MSVGHGEKVQFNQSVFIGFLAEERQVEDVFCSPVTNKFFLLGHPHLSGVAEM